MNAVIRQIDPLFSATSQLSADDFVEIAALGYRTIICNRPDGESADQPTSAEIQRAAQAAGLQFAYLPVVPNQISDDQAHQFRQLLETLPGPTLAYCRSGARSTKLHQMATSAPA